MTPHVHVIPETFIIRCDECRRIVGTNYRSRSAANQAANRHRREDRAKAVPDLRVHEAKLGVPA
ncbi:MAG: hypothetical protein WAN74_07795 [Thermoplasmata archaeon]